MIPLRYAPITLDMYIVYNADDARDTPGLDHFTDTNTSTTWQIENVQVKASACTLDASTYNQVAGHILNGGGLKNHYDSSTTRAHALTGVKGRMQMHRSLTRISAVFAFSFL